MLTGGAITVAIIVEELLKIVRSTAQFARKVSTTAAELLKNAGKIATSTMQKALTQLLRFFQQGTDNILKILDDFFAALKKQGDETRSIIFSLKELFDIAQKANIKNFYSKAEISKLVSKAKNLNLNLNDFEGFILTGNIKQIKPKELIEQMNNYINIVLKRGYPFGFKSKYSYMKFIKKIETHILELYKGYKIEVKIQGSSIRKNNPKDIDVGIIVKEEDFIKIVEKSFKKPTEGTAKYRGMLHALEKGKITSNYADLSKFRRDIESVYGEIDLSIIKKNGEFDIKPNF